jgi:hypothetical protein
MASSSTGRNTVEMSKQRGEGTEWQKQTDREKRKNEEGSGRR